MNKTERPTQISDKKFIRHKQTDWNYALENVQILQLKQRNLRVSPASK